MQMISLVLFFDAHVMPCVTLCSWKIRLVTRQHRARHYTQFDLNWSRRLVDDFELNNGHCPSDTGDLGHIVFNTAGDGRGKILESFRPTACMLNFRRSAFNALFSNLDKSPGGASPKNGYACLSSAYQVKQDCFNRSCSEKASLSERFAAKKCESMLTQTA